LGEEHKNMDKVLKLGPMDTFIKVNLKIVNGAVREF
jgi:hypothetical protein